MAKKNTDLNAPPLPPGVPPDGPPVAGAGDEKAKPPEYGTPKPAGQGDLPRVVDPLARAGGGEQRFKIACRNYTPRKTRYVLAAAGDAESAVRCYLAAEGLDRELARLRKAAGAKADEVEEPELVVTALDD